MGFSLSDSICLLWQNSSPQVAGKKIMFRVRIILTLTLCLELFLLLAFFQGFVFSLAIPASESCTDIILLLDLLSSLYNYIFLWLVKLSQTKKARYEIRPLVVISLELVSIHTHFQMITFPSVAACLECLFLPRQTVIFHSHLQV